MTITTVRRSESEEDERRVSQEGDVTMPFYIVVDKSRSMEELEKALNDALRAFQQLIIDHPEVSDVVQVCIIVFDSTASVLVPMGELETADLRDIVASGGTNYSSAITLLRSTIDSDLASLKSRGFKAYRPCVFFLSDGEPNPSDRDWEATFQREFGFNPETGEGNRQYARVIPFGFGDAEMATIAKLAYPPKDGVAFIQKNGATVEEAFAAILPLVGRTILASGNTALTPAQDAGHVLPQTLPGFEPVPSQYAGGDWM